MTFSRKKIFASLSLVTILFYGCGGGGGTPSTAHDSSGGSDTQKPHITLNGDKTILLNIGESFNDPGATAFDDVDGDISSLITKEEPSIDTSAIGEYEIIYSVGDKAGNIDTAKRKVVVMEMISDPELKKSAKVVINEILATNSHIKFDPDFKQFSDYIELYNNRASSQNIGGYYLSDDPTNLKKWKIPSKTLGAKQRILIWADKVNKQGIALHTNFSLDSDGETVILSDSNGKEIDKITFKKQKRDISVTKLGDRNYYMIPTPKTENKNALSALFKSKKPIFDQESGFYSGAQKITLSHENGATIYYTTDGSIPTLESAIFSKNSPISLSKTTVIRARALENGKFLSSIVNHTFLINENITLPVVSIGIDDKYLFGDDIGIYVAGKDSNGKTYASNDFKNLNYYQPWKRAGSLEFIKNNKSQFSINVGFKIFGHNSRVNAQKSLAVYVKKQFGIKTLEYPLFEQKKYIKEVKSFILRTGATEWGRTLIGDGIQQTIIKDTMDLDHQAYEPVIVFINGQYWGIHSIREKENADYLKANHNVDPKHVDILANEVIVAEGSDKAYNELLAQTDTKKIISQIDLNEFINYYITEAFTGNGSVNHNVKYWLSKPNGKWRWLLFDLDRGFRYVDNKVFAYLEESESHAIFTKLLKDEQFVHKFASQFYTHLNTTFQTQRMNRIITEIKEKIEPEIDRNCKRWPKDIENNDVSRETWEDYMNKMYLFSDTRKEVVLQTLQDRFNLSGDNSLQIPTATNGTIYIDGVKLTDNFNGHYFNGATVTLKAVPNEGYRFVKWSDNNRDQIREITLNSNQTLNAIFESAPTPKIVINEINYKSDKNHDSGDWVELYNNDANAIDLSNWELKDDSINKGYMIPANTTLQSGAYLIICEDKVAFSKFHNTKALVVGDFPFGLSKIEDSVKLYNNQGALVDQIHYDKTWSNAKGDSETLSLIDPNSDNTLSTNWIDVDNFGTPGEKN